MTAATFTPRQKTLYDALIRVDVKLLTIARTVITEALATDFTDGPDPEDLGAPVNSPAWAVLENAIDVFDKASSGDDTADARAALDVINAVLAGRR